MLTPTVPNKTPWADPFGSDTARKPFEVETINGVAYLRRKIITDGKDHILEEQRKLIPILDQIHDAADEALLAVTEEKRKQTEVGIQWRAFHYTSNKGFEIVCIASQKTETDHVVLLAEKGCEWPSILDGYFPTLPVLTTPHEKQAGTTVISLDGYRHKLNDYDMPDAVRIVYPGAIATLKRCIENDEGPLYAFDFKPHLPRRGQGSFQAILRLH